LALLADGADDAGFGIWNWAMLLLLLLLLA
jgi:hypothetical protein